MDTDRRRVVAGRYRLLSRLGSGGMGTVWRAEDEVLGRAVAVKEVTFPLGLSDEEREVLRERTRREARAAARLDHPSAVTVYDVVEENGSPFLVMELVEARTLSQVVRSDGPLTPKRTAQVGLALLGALETAHRQGIVHRDVKPGNVLLCAGDDGRVVLTDFGIASSVGDSSITSTGLLLGSPSYIAPERAKGQTPGPASDLWSLGATLFTAVEGRPPFDGGDPMTTVTAVVTGEHEPFVAAGPLVPVLEGLLEREPEQRITADAARALLRPLAVTARPVAAAEPASAATERRTERTTAMSMRDVREAADEAQDAAGGAAAAPATLAQHRPGDDGGHDQDDQRTVVEPAPVLTPLASRPPKVRPAPRRRARAPLAVLGAALVLGLAGVAGYALSTGGADDTPRRDAGRAGSAEPSADASAEPAAVPAGWSLYESEQGWSVAVPPGYVQSMRGGQVQLRDEQTRRTLRVDAAPARGTAVEAAQALSRGLAGRLRDYREVDVEPAQLRGRDAADLEFTYFDQTELHVLDRTIVAEGTAYRLYWQTRERDFAESLPVFEQIAKTFTPAS